MKRKITEALNTKMNAVHAGANRQKLHLMADIGWISDPNGLARLNGTTHIFHQYTPDKANGLEKSWGHYTTKDYIHYIDEGTLMCPDKPFDKDGCYSGSGMVINDKLHLYYTGNHLQDGDFDYINEGRGHDTVHLSSDDGHNFTERKVLLENKDYPANMSCHVRDPKLSWVDGKLYMVLGARTKDSQGCALLYEVNPDHPEDLQFVQVIESPKLTGYMWECPDLVDLDGQTVLICCPQGIETDGLNYENIYQNGWYSLKKNEEGRFEAFDFQELDNGFDFYAPQSFRDEKGREILIGWMGMPDADYDYPEEKEGWIHCLTLPRELHWKDGRIWQYPVAELEELRSEKQDLTLEAGVPVVLNDRVFELQAAVDNKPFELSLRRDVKLSWNGQVLSLSLQESGHGRKSRHIETDHVDSLQIFSDESSLEIFINRGEYCFSTRVYDQHQPLSILCDRTMKAELYSLQSIEVDFTPALQG